MIRRGTREIKRSTKGESYIAAGLVLDHKKVGCPPCDTVYLSLYRGGKVDLFLAITPEEAEIIGRVLVAAVARSAQGA